MRRHVAWTVGCCFLQLLLIRSCIKSLPLGAAKAAVAAFVTSRVDRYNSLLAGSPACLLDGLQPVVNAAARLICNRRKYDHVAPLLRDVLHWLPVPFRIEYKLCLLVFQSLHGAAPEYLRDCCTATHSSASGLRLRSLERTDLRVRRMRTHFGIVRSRLPVLDVGTVSRLLFVLLTKWPHLKPSLKLICSLRPTQCSCL